MIRWLYSDPQNVVSVHWRYERGENFERGERGGKSVFKHSKWLCMLNVCYRRRRQLFPGTKILKNDLLMAEKINFEVVSKIFLKKNRVEKIRFFSMEIQWKLILRFFGDFLDFRFSLILHWKKLIFFDPIFFKNIFDPTSKLIFSAVNKSFLKILIPGNSWRHPL